MRKVKKFAKRIAAFAMAAVVACSGFLGYFAGTGMIEAQAATVNGTVDADKFSWDNATVYFLLTDRFRNGNSSNDHSYGRGLNKNGSVANIADTRGTFHGGDFAGVTQTIKDGYFNDLGVNAIWISAPYEQIHGYLIGSDDNPSFAHYAYHGYYVLDYTNTDANFGTAEEFKTLVDTAHEHGIRVIIDVVLNHSGYNSMYDMNEYNFGTLKSGWEDAYYSYNNVSNAVYHSFIDYEGSASDWARWWGADWVRAGVAGYTKGEGSAYVQSLAGLPDFKTESSKEVTIPTFLAEKWKKEGRYDQEVAELKNYLSKNGYKMTVTNCISYWLSTWVREYGVDGFRCDTAKHVENASWRVLHDMCTDALKEWKAANPDKALDDSEFWMTGEAWDHKVGYDEYYTVGKFDSMINFDTWGASVLGKGTVAGKYSDYAGAINSKDDFNVLSFMSSHDSVIARGDQIYLGSAFLMLPGGVQIYYGDESNRPMAEGVPNDGNGGAGHSLRSDMNWDSLDEEVLAHWQKVGTFRNNHIAVGAGAHTNVTATSGVGFTRTYSKNGVSDRIAAVIGASANKDVTIDVSGVWADGSVVTNYYDYSSAIVTGGKVTFNSGATGTILVGDPDGKPLVSVKGDAKFKGTQTVTISIKDADYAIVSVDGAKKFIAHDGDQFQIGATAYEGDTVSVSYEATNKKGTISGKSTFYKAYADEVIEDEGGNEEEVVVPGKVRVKMSDGSAPYLYAWIDEQTKLTGGWPGTKMTQKDSEGYYYMDLDTTETYNVIFNGGSDAAQTDDITGLKGEVTFEVNSGFGSYKQTGGVVEQEKVNNTVTIRVNNPSAPHLYVWNDDGNYNGGFPGKQLTEKDENGNWVFVVDGVPFVNCIVSSGSNQNQSKDISGITGEVLITVNNGNYQDYKVEKTEKPESKFDLMKKEARGIKNMSASDYTTASWNALYAYVDDADALVALGEEAADPTAVTNLYNKIVAAKKALVLAAPKLHYAVAGKTTIKGTAAYGANVTVTVNGKAYTAQASEITGVWTVTVSSLSSSATIYATASRDGLSSEKLTYSMSSGNVDNPVVDPDDPTDPDDPIEPDDPIDPTDPLSASLLVNGSTAAITKTVGSTITMNASATGGSGNYTYKFAVLNVKTGNWFVLKDFNSTSSYTTKLSVAGVKQFAVTVKDSTGATVATNRITVTATDNTTKLSASLLVNGSTAEVTQNVGTSVTINAKATGGSGNYTYKFAVFNETTKQWFVLKDFSSVSTYTSELKVAGVKQFAVTVKDSAGATVSTNRISVTAVESESNLSASLLVNGSTAEVTQNVGSTVTLNATATGGSGSYLYKFAVYNETTGKWFVLKDFSSDSTYTSALAVAGAKQFAVSVKDSMGKTVSTNRIRVTAVENSQSVINFTSNVSDTVKYEYNSDSSQVTITYYLQSDYKIVDTQAIISYDKTVLSIADINTPSSAIPSFLNGGILNFNSKKGIMFCATNLNLYDFTTEDIYFTVTFDIIGSGDTTVDLEIEYLSATTATTLSEVLDKANDVQLVDYSEVLKNDAFTCRVEAVFEK